MVRPTLQTSDMMSALSGTPPLKNLNLFFFPRVSEAVTFRANTTKWYRFRNTEIPKTKFPYFEISGTHRGLCISEFGWVREKKKSCCVWNNRYSGSMIPGWPYKTGSCRRHLPPLLGRRRAAPARTWCNSAIVQAVEWVSGRACNYVPSTRYAICYRYKRMTAVT